MSLAFSKHFMMVLHGHCHKGQRTPSLHH